MPLDLPENETSCPATGERKLDDTRPNTKRKTADLIKMMKSICFPVPQHLSFVGKQMGRRNLPACIQIAARPEREHERAVIRSYATGRSFFQSSNPLRRYQHNQIAGESASINAFEVSGTIPHLGKGVQIGQVATTTRIYSVLDVESFASCVQDHNPIHSAMDWETAVNSDAFWKIYQQNKMIEFNDSSQGKITKPIVHGMLVSSIFSSIFASLSPGCIYMNQTLSFENPVYVNDKVVGKIEIEKIRKWRKGGVVVQCKTEAFVLQDEKVQDGTMAAMSQDELHLVNRIAVKGTANVWLPSGYKS